MAPLIPTMAARARSILSSAVAARSQAMQTASDHLPQLGPLAARALLLARDDDDKKEEELDPSSGVTNPNDINNTFVFIIFGLIGAAFVLTGIWFFFWAKNGGFYFKEDDWEEYKSTVLRRRGPNGTILSNATPVTDLGGGSVYKDVDDSRTEYTGGLTQMTGETGDTGSTLSGITAGPSDIGGRERRRQQREKKEREREKRRDRRTRRSGRKVDEDGVLVDEEAEADAKRNLRAYRHERAARVGGLNKESEGSEWDGSTNPEMSTVSGSDLLLHNRQNTPTKEKEKRRNSTRDHHQHHHNDHDTATEMSYVSQSQESQTTTTTATTNNNNNNNNRKAGGIRKVYSTADRTTTRENEQLRAEARRMAREERSERGHRSSAGAGGVSSSASLRRDFSFQRARADRVRSVAPESTIAEEQETGSLMDNGEHDHHPHPHTNTNINNNNTQAGHGGRYLPPPSSWGQESDIADGSDMGTKSYRHYIPGISSPSSAPSAASGDGGAEDRRERRRRQRVRQE